MGRYAIGWARLFLTFESFYQLTVDSVLSGSMSLCSARRLSGLLFSAAREAMLESYMIHCFASVTSSLPAAATDELEHSSKRQNMKVFLFLFAFGASRPG